MKSPLVIIGAMLIVIAVVLPRPVSNLAQSMDAGTLKMLALISVDVLRLGFFAGIACLIIGLLRRRKST